MDDGFVDNCVVEIKWEDGRVVLERVGGGLEYDCLIGKGEGGLYQRLVVPDRAI